MTDADAELGAMDLAEYLRSAERRGDMEQWVGGLERYGHRCCVRALVALSRLTLPLWESAYPHDPSQRRAIEAAEAWLADPGTAQERAAHLACEESYRSRIAVQAEGPAELAASAAEATSYAAAARVLSPGIAPRHVAANALRIVVAEVQSLYTGEAIPTQAEITEAISRSLGSEG